MTNQQLFFTNVTLDELTDQVADKVVLRLSKTTNTENPSPSSQEDILFKSLKEASNYFGICYQTLSKNLDKIRHIPFGRSYKIYKSDIEAALLKEGIMSRRKGGSK